MAELADGLVYERAGPWTTRSGGNVAGAREISIFPSVIDVFPVTNVGFTTHRDYVALAFSPSEMLNTVRDFIDEKLTDPLVAER